MLILSISCTRSCIDTLLMKRNLFVTSKCKTHARLCRLPFMKETSSRDASQKAFWKHAKDQVVGQIFFPATTRVDTYKLKFNQVTSLHTSCRHIPKYQSKSCSNVVNIACCCYFCWESLQSGKRNAETASRAFAQLCLLMQAAQ